MDLKVVSVANSKDKAKVKEIYTSSFQKEDRMPFWLMLLMARLPSTDFLALYDNNILCGFVYMATIKELTFVMFFAVDQTLRSKGYGSGILDKVQSLYPNNKIIVSIERCDETANDLADRVRRKNFYLNNGYTETGYLVELAKKQQQVLVKNGPFEPKAFTWFFIRYSNGTMLPKLYPINAKAGQAAN